jgi:hypothetical protein
MTVGALYQIKNYNKNATNNFLEINPQISFYKIVYRKYARFAMENIKFDTISRNTLVYDETVNMKATVPRNGDLLRNIYLTFELPDIYSGKCVNDGVSENYEFKWIENIGINIFNKVSLKINDQIISTLYSDYVNIWKELHLSDDEKRIFNENIGHVKEIYDPKNGLGQNGNYPHITTTQTPLGQSSKYSSKKIDFKGHNIVFDHSDKIETNTTNTYTNIFPSIQSRKIKVPLPFSFASNSGLAIPLIALQYSALSVEFEMKQFRDLYTIIDAKYSKDGSPSFNKRIKPKDQDHHKIDYFTNSYNFNITPNLEGEYIFLDDEERKRFAIHDHEYLIEQPRIMNKDGSTLKHNIEETPIKIYSAFNPVKYLTWVIKRDDFKHINEWSNYSNWINQDIPPYSNSNIYNDCYYSTDSSKDVFYSIKNSNHVSDFTNTNLKKNMLTNVKIEFDGNLRIDKDADYFSKQQIYQHFKKKALNGIYVYSFSLNPLDYQPSGSCNFSDINNPMIYFKKHISTFSSDNNKYDFKVYLFIVSYNIFVIKNGIGNLKFVN